MAGPTFTRHGRRLSTGRLSSAIDCNERTGTGDACNAGSTRSRDVGLTKGVMPAVPTGVMPVVATGVMSVLLTGVMSVVQIVPNAGRGFIANSRLPP